VKLVFTGEYPVIPEQTISLDFLCEVIKIKILEKLREQMSGIYDASVNATTNKRPYEHYTINISFPCGPEHVDTLTHALLDIIDDIRNNGVEKKYLVSVSKMLSQHHAYLMNTSEFWLQLLSGAWINNEDPKWALKYYDTVDGISSRDLQKTADKYFDMNNYVKEILLPN
jgi:zinc protease